MEALLKPDVILTHESDLDGLLSALLLRRLAVHLFGSAVPVQAFHNQGWRQRAMTERVAWVCDFAFEARVDRPGWLVIDHHPQDTAPRQARLIHDPAKSSALLCLELCETAGLASESVRRLVHLSNVADLFLTEDPDFVVAMDYASLVKHYGFWPVHTLIEGEPERLMDHPLLRVMRVKREVEDPLGLAWSRERITRITGEIGLVETLVGNVNLIVHHLLESGASSYPVLMTLYRRGNAGYVASLRSRNGLAQVIAEKLHGGGHPNASGANLPRSVQSLPDAVAYLRQVLEPAPPPVSTGDPVRGLFDAVQF
jgi:hypothetical protein